GIEVIPEAIEDAKRNAERNGISNAEFYCGKAEEVLPEFYEKKRKTVSGGDDGSSLHPDVIVVDPPRKGCDFVCLETMLKMQPERIVYVSCDSATLARDLRILADGGYEIKAIRPCDMFPWTVHVEVVSLLQKNGVYCS
ncbi:MAG: class I SAM-dependent RNA methyltransferase, partial [Butyrivibrio sp.]|nr:class I SAM-dependent RNA methyltransferase [Butyrivibrio sp.]